jgi:transcription elongation factor Elf1
MIWRWFGIALLAFFRFVWPPPADFGRRIKPNLACPACGNEDGTLRFVRLTGDLSKRGDVREIACPKCSARAVSAIPEGLRCAQCGEQFSIDADKTIGMVMHVCGVCQFAHYLKPVSVARWPAC